MAVRRMARVLLPLAWVNSSLFSYGRRLHGASIIAVGLCNLIFAIVWLYVVWREYHYLWPGLIHLCYHMAVRHMVRVFLPLAWVTSCLPPYGGTPYGTSIIAFGLGYLIFRIVWLLYVLWRDYQCLWPGLVHLWLYGCTLYGASIIAFGLGHLICAIVWLYAVWREYYCLWPGFIHLWYHTAVCRMAQVSLPLA